MCERHNKKVCDFGLTSIIMTEMIFINEFMLNFHLMNM